MVYRFSIRNRLLAALSRDDYALLEPLLERMPLSFQSVLIVAYQLIEHVHSPRKRDRLGSCRR